MAKVPTGFGLVVVDVGRIVLGAVAEPGLFRALCGAGSAAEFASCSSGSGSGAASTRAWGGRIANEQAAKDSLLV